MATRVRPNAQPTAIVPRQEVLPPVPVALERLYLDAMAQPPTGGITGWWADMQRRQNARRLANELFAEIQKAYQAALLNRYNLSLQLQQQMVEEYNRLQLARVRSQVDELIARDHDRRMVSRRIEMVRQLLDIQRKLVQMGVDEETVNRKVGQYVERLIDALGTELTAGGHNAAGGR